MSTWRIDVFIIVTKHVQNWLFFPFYKVFNLCLFENQSTSTLIILHFKSMVLLIYIYFELKPNFVIYEYSERVISYTHYCCWITCCHWCIGWQFCLSLFRYLIFTPKPSPTDFPHHWSISKSDSQSVRPQANHQLGPSSANNHRLMVVEYLYNLLVFMPAGWYSQLIINPPKVLKDPSCIIHCPIMRVAGIVLYRVSTVVTESNLFWSEKAFFSSQLGLLLFLHFEYDIHLVIGFSVPTLFSF